VNKTDNETKKIGGIYTGTDTHAGTDAEEGIMCQAQRQGEGSNQGWQKA